MKLTLLALVALAIVAAVVGYWLVGTPDARAKAATASAAPARETPVFLREPDAPRENAPEQREQVEEAAHAPDATNGASSARVVADAIVVGRAVDRSRRPLADVVVASKYPVLETRSGVDGSFELHCPSAGNGDGIRLRLSLAHTGYGAAGIDNFVRYGETFDAGEIVLPGAGAVAGRVVDESGAPFGQAEVRVTEVDLVPHGPAYHRPLNSLVDGASDANGNFRLADVRAGPVRVWAGADEHLWAVSDPLDVPELGVVSGIELVVRKVDRDDLIRMTVIDPQGAPVPRARIAYFGQSGNGSWSGSNNADEAGRYTHYLQTRAPHDFTASDPENRYRPAVATGVRPGTLDLVLQLAPSRRLAVAVRDARGNAVERYRVNRTTRRGGNSMSEKLVDDGVHVDGRADFELPVELFELEVDALGFELARVGPLDPATVGAEVVVTLTTVPGVRGKVIAAGEPFAGASVTLLAAVAPNQEHIVNGFPARSQRSRSTPVITGDDGTFKATLRDGGRYYVRAVAYDWAPAEIGPFELDPANGARDLVLELTHGGTVVGHVLAKDGESSANVIVGASRGDSFAVTTRADSAGAFHFTQLTPGRWWIGRHDQEISGSGTHSQTGTSDKPVEIPWNCVVVEGQTTSFDVAPVPDDLVHLRGEIVYGDKPAAGWEVNLSPKSQGVNPGRETTIGADGRFEVGAREPGEFYLVVTSVLPASRFHLFALLTLHAGENSFEFATQLGRIEGRVASFDASHDACSWVWQRESAQVSGSFAPDADGRFTLPAVPLGSVKLQRWNSEDDSTASEIEVTVQAGATAQAAL